MFDVIVVGASVTGLVAAAAAARAGRRVLLLDRDEPTDGPEARRTVPHARQIHALLDAGRLTLEELLPGIFDEIEADGGGRVDYGRGMRWYHSGAFKVVCDTPFRAQVQSRGMLEQHIRRRVCALDGVEVRYGTKITGLLGDARQVRGVLTASGDELVADVVICATGRSALAQRWLEGIGVPAPPVKTVDLNLGYATRLFSLPAAWPEDRWMWVTYGTRPKTTRHGLAFRVEGDRVQIALAGYEGDLPPTDLEGFREFAAGLELPELGGLIDQCMPLDEGVRFSVPQQTRRAFHRVPMPRGVVVLGDAACALDPVFGQGMTVAALQAGCVGRELRRSTVDTRRLQRKTAAVSLRAWLITSVEAARYRPAAKQSGIPGVTLLHRWLDAVYAASAHDPGVHIGFLDVMNLHKPAAWLFHPRVVAGVVWSVARRLAGASPAAIPAAQHHARVGGS